MMASDLTVTQAAYDAQQTTVQKQQLAEDFDDFLTLLTIQLQNQDPLSPMDSTEFTNQLVSFAGVEQQINANEKLNSLVEFGLSNMNTFALGYVGMKANYQSSELYYDGTTPVDISYIADGVPVSVDVRILDQDGNTVAFFEGETGAGRKDTVWDGMLNNGLKAESGTYQVRIDAVDGNDNTLNSNVLVSGVIHGVETQNGQPYLLIGERAVPIGNVINVSLPQTTTTTSEETSGEEGGSA
ncbi:MAG: flagellar hook capping family protein [Rhodospirillales bacterium]|nr:flagellar hook capping family protein [Rhodospirillales bacterium]